MFCTMKGCMPNIHVGYILSPLLILILLYLVKPSFVMRKDLDGFRMDYTRLFRWTLVLTILAWIGLWMYCRRQR